MEAVTVIGSGGGAGATTVVAELALALAALGRRVAAIDADLGVGDLGLRLGIVAAPSLADVIAGGCALSQALHAASGGLRVVAAGRCSEPARALLQGERLRLIEELDATGRELDVILFDAGTWVAPNTVFFASAAQRIVLVTTPAVEARHKTVAVLSAISAKVPKASVHVLVNRSRTESDGRRAFLALACASEPTLRVGLHYLGAFPLDEEMEQVPQARSGGERTRVPAVRRASETIAAQLVLSAAASQHTGGLCLFSR